VPFIWYKNFGRNCFLFSQFSRFIDGQTEGNLGDNTALRSVQQVKSITFRLINNHIVQQEVNFTIVRAIHHMLQIRDNAAFACWLSRFGRTVWPERTCWRCGVWPTRLRRAPGRAQNTVKLSIQAIRLGRRWVAKARRDSTRLTPAAFNMHTDQRPVKKYQAIAWHCGLQHVRSRMWGLGAGFDLLDIIVVYYDEAAQTQKKDKTTRHAEERQWKIKTLVLYSTIYIT